MSTITTKDGTEIFYKDWGKGQPIVFHHGWPLSADDWDNQMMFFLAQGYRVIAHDRRGHGRSSQTATGNDMDTYAADVAELAEQARSEERDPCRPFHRRRRSHALRGPARPRPRRQGGDHQRDPAGDGEVGEEPRRHADRGVRRLTALAWPPTARNSISISRRARSTASTVPARRSRRASSTIGGVRA